jgi:Protein of unknown function (DUF3562)
MVAMMSNGPDAERRQHASAIHMLSLDSGLPEDSVQQLYETELKNLTEHARIRDFLSVLVIRRIKERIHDLNR